MPNQYFESVQVECISSELKAVNTFIYILHTQETGQIQ